MCEKFTSQLHVVHEVVLVNSMLDKIFAVALFWVTLSVKAYFMYFIMLDPDSPVKTTHLICAYAVSGVCGLK